MLHHLFKNNFKNFKKVLPSVQSKHKCIEFLYKEKGEESVLHKKAKKSETVRKLALARANDTRRL